VTAVERRPSRMATVAAAAAIAVVAAVLLAGGDEAAVAPAPEPPPLPTTVPAPALVDTTVRLALAGGRDLTVVDLGKGTSAVAPLPDRSGTVSQPPLVTASGHTVVVERSVAWSFDREALSLDPRTGGPPVRLGRANTVIPADRGDVWLVDFRSDTATAVAPDGSGPRGEPISLPDGSSWAEPLNVGFLLSSPDRWLHVARTGRVLGDRAGSVLASDGDHVVWADAQCPLPECRVHVTDMAWGTERTFLLSATDFTFVNDAGVSPNGRWLALAGDLVAARSGYEVALVDLGREPLGMAVVAASLESPALALAVDDDWLFWTRRPHGARETTVTAYDIGRRRATELDLPVADVVAFSAF